MSLQFYRRNAWWLLTGVLLTFASSFGQTYFIALSAGGIREAFDLSHGAFGSLYTLGTIGSALLLVRAGHLVDTLALKHIAVALLAAYGFSALLMMSSTNLVMLTLAIFGLRFCGQGMMGLVTMTAMARWFAANRARAMAVAFLGYPLGEAVLPLVAVEAQELFGWRGAWGLVAAIILLMILPAAFALLRHGRVPQGEGDAGSLAGMGGRHWTRREVLRHWSFYALLPGILASPFIGTCAFFHQVHIAQIRGFDLATMALAFPLYAVMATASAFVAGAAIDRLGVTRILPFMLVPLVLAITLLAVPGEVWLWFLTMAGFGIGQGITMTLLGTLWPTLYGTRWLGSVKSIVSASMVLATALGPGVSGLVIDLGLDFTEQALFYAAYCVAMTVLFSLVAPRLTRELARPAPQPA